MSRWLTQRTDQRWALLALISALLLALSISLQSGAVPIAWNELTGAGLNAHVFWQIRLPRALLAALVGAALATSGAATQGLFRNPLADPTLIGIGSGAALAVALVVVLGAAGSTLSGTYLMGVAAFIGGLLTTAAIFAFARASGSGIAGLLLAGLALNALAGAVVGLLTFFSTDQQLRTLTFWSMGSLGGAQWPQVWACASIAVPALILLLTLGRGLNLLGLGESEARHLGLNPVQLQRLVVVGVALAVGAAVAVAGLIGFIGLVVPHLLRLAFGGDQRWLLPGSALCGAALLSAADTGARLLMAPAELPVGTVTSLLGAPFFLWLLWHQRGWRT